MAASAAFLSLYTFFLYIFIILLLYVGRFCHTSWHFSPHLVADVAIAAKSDKKDI